MYYLTEQQTNMTSFFSGIITSKMRINILMRLFINPSTQVYLRELVKEFNASPSHIKDELDQLSQSNLLISKKQGRQVLFSANEQHPIYNELHSMVKKAFGMDKIIESILRRLGNLEKAILIDDYAEGKDTGIIDLVLVGDINQTNLIDLTKKTERYIDRKIRVLSFNPSEYRHFKTKLTNRPTMVIWQK